MILIACAPLLVAAFVLGFTRLPGWMAATSALISALPALWLNAPEDVFIPAFVLDETLKGSWLAFQAISVMVAGLYFYNALQSENAKRNSPAPALSNSQLFTLVVFAGPFVESAVGFGVGIVVVLGYLRQRGVAAMEAALLSLLSQTLVPWGAFGVGTLIGAQIADIALSDLAVGSAWLSVPLMLGWLPFFWRLARRIDLPSRSRLADSSWVLAATLLLVMANAWMDPQIALIVSFGLIIAIRQVSTAQGSAVRIRSSVLAVWPYLLLCTALLLTRLVEPLASWLQGLSRFQPFDDQLALSPFHHPGFWLLTVGSAALVVRRESPLPVLGATFSSAWRPVLVTLLFVILARWMISAGSAVVIAAALAGLLGSFTLLGSPILGGMAGFLTGSNAASNAMMMPVQTAMASNSHVPALFLQSVQNVAGSAMTALSPARIVFASSLAGGLDERALYRRAAGFALPPMVILLLLCLIARLVG